MTSLALRVQLTQTSALSRQSWMKSATMTDEAGDGSRRARFDARSQVRRLHREAHITFVDRDT